MVTDIVEPSTRGTNFLALKRAIEQLWGEAGLRDVAARLPADARRDTLEKPVSARDMLPARYLFAWFDAVHDGPARGDLQESLRFVDATMEVGFGTIRKLLLSVSSVEKILRMAGELWSYDHSHGKLETQFGEKTVTLVLRDYPVAKTERHWAMLAETFRHVASLSRAHGVTSSHKVDRDGTLYVTLRWQ